MARPRTVECEVCGVSVAVAPRGPVPRFCAAHGADDLPAKTVVLTESQQSDLVEVVKAEPPADGFPRRIAPKVWVDQAGNRYTDSGEAERACRAWRRGGR